MSDTPPKPKVGSLRDRIAAFEKPASTTPPGPPPTLRPKPAGFATWKPKVPSPPSSPAAGTTEHASSSAKAGGMSASDAKESITKAGSLKDRMAALQGKGAFGAPPSIAPKPVVEKPRWKPPPVVHAPVDVDDHPAGESSTANIAAVVERTISPPVAVKPQESIVRAEGEEMASSPPAAVSGEGEGDDTAESGPADPEEEERQRRAAIAARMARLGGARLGMAPPVFGKKPPVRRPTQEELPKAEEEEPKRGISSPETVKPADVPLLALSDENLLISPPLSTTPAVQETQSDARNSPEYFPKRKNSESTSILSSESTESYPARSPASMPVPSVPRRAGPPRKKPVKPAAPPPEVPEEETPVIEEEVSPPAVDEPKGEFAVESFESDLLADVQGLKAEIQREIEIPSADQPLAVPERRLSPPPVAEEATHISTCPPVTLSILPGEPLGIRSPPPSPLDTTEEEESEQLEVEGEDGGEDDESDIAEALTTPPIPVLLSPSREAPAAVKVAVAKHEKEPTPVSPPIASEEDTTDEAEEEERKKRVAERLARMGGINPFAMSPPMQPKPQQETPRSPPQVPVAFVPSSPSAPSAAQNRRSVIRSPSPEPTRKDSTTKSNAEEEEAFDENDDEGEVFENEPGPITNKHYEKPKDSRAEPLERPNIPVRPPVPPSSTRPPVQVQQFEADDDSGSDYGDDDVANTSAPSIPVNPPAKLTSPPKPTSPPARPAQPPRRIVPQTPEENEVEDEDEEGEEGDTDEEADERLAQSQLFIPPPTRRAPGAIPPNRRYLQDEEDGNGSESDSPALPILHRKSLEVPAGRPTQPPYSSDGNESWDPESDHDGQALPIPPRRTSGPPPPRVVPPPPPPALHHPPPVHRSPQPPAPAAVAHLLAISPPYVPRTASGSSEEILDEEEGDPIDPAFHSPSRRASTINLAPQAQTEAPAPIQSPPSPPAPPPTTSYRAPADQEQTGEAGKDADRLRRNTIAERMAKLGGIKFGAAPVPTPASHPSTRQPSNEEEGQAEDAAGAEQPTELSEEEEERARKERIAAKMASMGGMRIGMMPMGMGGFPPPRSHVLKEETVVSPPSLPPAARAVPPSRPPPPPARASQVPDSDSDYGSAAASEDGVKVEAEESSELEEVNYEDAVETEEEAPPPIPSRAVRPTRRQSSMDQPTSPPIPPSRPPVPTSVPARRRSSVQTTKSIGSTDNTAYGTPPQKSSGFMPSSQSEYVMVEEPESQETPPQPPVRYSRLPPMRSTPQAPTMQSSEAATESISSQWELPSIPMSTLDFGGGADLSLSWSDAGEPTSPTTSSQPSAFAPPSKRATLPAERQLSADDLIALWGRVGVQVCEIATSMFEKSKKTLIGDGTYTGFVQAVVATVPNAAAVPTASGEYGYVVYLQNGASVQKRASEIMPGDIVEIHDAKFKGHKGLQTYHQNVGAAGEDLVGVVGEFEAKKSKIRVFHANQHVGQQTVESVSYRLEDLKSGIVKVYRVLEA